MDKRGIGGLDYTQNPHPTGKTYFLGIGINNYNHFRHLHNACNDVQAIQKVLIEQYDFDVNYTSVLYDREATRARIVNQLYTYLGKATSEDRVVIYFAGHGILEAKSGFWLAADSIPRRKDSFINNAEVRDAIHSSQAKHILLFSDSCFSESLIVRDASTFKEGAFAEWSANKSRWVFSSGKGVVSDGPKGKYSPFNEKIVKKLKENDSPILNIGYLADQVTKEISWNYEQRAECSPLNFSGHDGGQFLFYLKRKVWYEDNFSDRSNINIAIERVSDFIIKSYKYSQLYPSLLRPMALQNRFFRHFTYVQTKWDSNTPVPYYARESWRDNQRPLPGQRANYPWLTVSDFLEPYLIRLPFPTDRGRFFDGNVQTSASDKGFLLPLKKDFFDFFDVDDLLAGRIRLKMIPQGNGINVTLDIPVTAPNQPGNQFITFERLYSQTVGGSTSPNETKNEGIIVENSFTVNIYPFVRSGSVTVSADYRVEFIESGFDSQNQYQLSYFKQQSNAEITPDSIHQRTFRQQNTDGSSVYYVLREEFDYLQVDINDQDRYMRGILIPCWQQYNGGYKQFSFSIEFNPIYTHIEYTVDGCLPRPFEVASEVPQAGTLVDPVHYNPALFELFVIYDLEFVPPTIGPGKPDTFPVRTAIAEHMRLNFNQQTYALAHFNIPFYLDRQPSGSNRITTNLNWDNTNEQNERRILGFLEELLMLIKNKVLTEGGILHETKIHWLYPAMMKQERLDQLRATWQILFDYYIGGHPNLLLEAPISVTPFYFYKNSLMFDTFIKPVINVYLDELTSNISVIKNNEALLLTSFRFAGNAIYGDAFSEYGAASHNGFVRKYADRIQTLLESQSLGNLSDSNRKILDTNRSEDIIAFWFSIEKSNDVKAKSMLSFNGMLAKDEDMKVVFVLFFTALLYHIAQLMKHKGINLPGAITFSGTGSKLLTIISSDDQMLGKLARVIFEKVYEKTYDVSGLTLFYERKGPKEVTCKGALMQPSNSRPVDTEAISYVYPATFNDEFPTLTYADLRKPEVIDSLLKETNAFIDFFFDVNQQFSYVRNLNVSAKSLAVAQQELHIIYYLRDSLMSGIDCDKRDLMAIYNGMSNPLKVPIEETMFFYPIIGAINNLANKLV